jgi:hypothetical protein
VTTPPFAGFSVEERTPLSPGERAVLANPALRLLGDAAAGRRYRVHVVADAPWPASDLRAVPEGRPARLEVVDGRVRVLHCRFLGEVDPHARATLFYRREPSPGGLAIVMRVALSCQLPLAGSLPLHAAGVLLDGRGLAFFGPSGAGKSTLASTFDGPVLSDELVAVCGEPYELSSTGVSGSLGETRATPGSGPLLALVELAKADAFSLELLPPRVARRRLLDVIQVPLENRLWCAALSALGRLVHAVPVYRMEWTRSEPPWARLREWAAGIPVSRDDCRSFDGVGQ